MRLHQLLLDLHLGDPLVHIVKLELLDDVTSNSITIALSEPDCADDTSNTEMFPNRVLRFRPGLEGVVSPVARARREFAAAVGVVDRALRG